MRRVLLLAIVALAAASTSGCCIFDCFDRCDGHGGLFARHDEGGGLLHRGCGGHLIGGQCDRCGVFTGEGLLHRGCGGHIVDGKCDRCGGLGSRLAGALVTCDPYSGGGSAPPGADAGYAGGPPTAQVTYPYYTVRGPRDFLAANPRSIGP